MATTAQQMSRLEASGVASRIAALHEAVNAIFHLLEVIIVRGVILVLALITAYGLITNHP
jgi:hypothetical protein